MPVLVAVRAEVRSGLERASLLPTGTGFASVEAIARMPWGGELDATIRAELGWHPRDGLMAFAFAEAGIHEVQAGLGVKLVF